MEGEQSRLPRLSLLSGKICEIYAVDNGRPASGRRQVASGVPSPSFPPSKSYAYFVVSLPIPRDRARLGGQF